MVGIKKIDMKYLKTALAKIINIELFTLSKDRVRYVQYIKVCLVLKCIRQKIAPVIYCGEKDPSVRYERISDIVSYKFIIIQHLM
jgi:hypothetical protein